MLVNLTYYLTNCVLTESLISLNIKAHMKKESYTNEELLAPQHDYLSYAEDPSWERNGIRDKPLAAIITLLTKLQLDIKLQELRAIRKLISK